MATAKGITIKSAAVRRAWREADGGAFMLLLRTKTGTEAAFLDAVDETEANQVRMDGIQTQGGAHLPSGFTVEVEGAESAEELDTWLTDLAQRLERAGFDGTLQAAKVEYGPRWIASHFPAPVGFVAWEIDPVTSVEKPHGWHLRHADTMHLFAELAAWAAQGGPSIVMFRSDVGFRINDADRIAHHLTAAVEGPGMAGTICHHDRAHSGRAVKLSGPNEGSIAVIGDVGSTAERVSLTREALISVAHQTTVSFIRPASAATWAWGNVEAAQPFEHLDRHSGGPWMHLVDRWVPDAHGIQILTDAHLERAHDLTEWNITDLGHGRHLVEARNLDAWYFDPDPALRGLLDAGPPYGSDLESALAASLPRPDIVAQARHDFGDLILTDATRAENPPNRA